MIILFFLLFLISSSLSAQKITKDNYSGDLTDNNSWQNPPAPGIPVSSEVLIYGNIQHIGDITFNQDLTIIDTLRIFGNMTMGSNDVLTINSSGVLIIYGDYYPGNQTTSVAGGTLVITGDLHKSGGANNGSFDVGSGTVYIFGDVINGGDGYGDLQCVAPEVFPDCGYGDEENLEEDPIFDLFESGSYSISASGPTEFCDGGSVTLSVSDEGSWYQWYQDNTEITGAGSYSYVADETGDYHVRMVVGTDTLSLTPVKVTVKTNSIAPTSAITDRNNICPGDGNIVLSYTGGTHATEDIAQWYSDSGFITNVGSGNDLTIPAPSNTTEYFVRFEGDCDTTDAVSVVVSLKELPVEANTADVDRPFVCPSDGNIVLSYSGGSSGTGGTAMWYSDAGYTNLVGTGNDINVPAPATTQTYYLRFEADCGNSPAKSVTVTVNPLPTLTFDAVAPVCINTTSFDFTQGSPAGGIYSGAGITASPQFDPATAGAGIHTITYTFTDANGCSNSATRDITVNLLPIVSFAAIDPVCVNATDFTLTQGSPAGGTYSGTGVSGNTFSPATAGSGTHTITYTYTDANGCNNSATRGITVNTLPSPTVIVPAEVCKPGTGILFTALNAGHSYAWTVTGGAVISGTGTNQITVEFDTAGIAQIQVTETNDSTGCSGISTIYEVVVHDIPTMNEIESSNRLISR